MDKVSFSDVIGIAGICLAVVITVLDKAGKLKGGWLYGLLILAGVMTLFIAIGNGWVLDAPTKWRFWRGLLMFCVVGFTYSGLTIWIAPSVRRDSEQAKAAESVAKKPPKPNFIFVFGVPLGDNDSPEWVMIPKHFGPSTAYACNITFYDDDRINIENLWLAKHPDSAYPPQGLADGESRIQRYFPEGSPEQILGYFIWRPLNPDAQHYTVVISCREGVFEEKWAITRVNGILRSAITIKHGPQWAEKNPGQDTLVFQQRDPEFVSAPLIAEMPKGKSAKAVSRGWRPSHKYTPPVAILDPNNNVQSQAATGSWEILLKHLGDD